MNKIILFFILVLSISCSKKIRTTEQNKDQTINEICDAFNEVSFSFKEANNYDFYLIEKYIEEKLNKYELKKRELIKQRFYSQCNTYLEYAIIRNKRADSINGETYNYKAWDKFIVGLNKEPWGKSHKKEFLDLCFKGLKSKPNYKFLCNCVIDKISEKMSSKDFYSLNEKDRARLAGQISYIYCPENKQ